MLEDIQKLIAKILVNHDVYLDDIEYVQENNEWYLRIFIEKNEGSLDMDTCVAVSEDISDALDEADIVKNEYYLEVSSPGVEKPLKTFEKVREAIGQYVYVELSKPTQGLEEFYGTIVDIEDQTIHFEYLVKNIKKQCYVEYKDISFIRLAVQF